ncbi:hypothetical protein HaLaN_21812 [Haematococcus lacustris]|uniref:Uncharacterized protein n=1 Tax=Haematococcus lacustris TaxID=44745 RepID=A0A699ZMN0_HAELA|nr:hypothetical protein HaLaN_21812 [Haematococcus lacustris]
MGEAQHQAQAEQQAGAAAVVARLQGQGAEGEGGWGVTARLPAPAAWRGACCPTHAAEGHPAWAAHQAQLQGGEESRMR